MSTKRFLKRFIFIYGCFLVLLTACTPQSGTAVSSTRIVTPTIPTVTATATTVTAAPTTPPTVTPTAIPPMPPTDMPRPTLTRVPPASLWLSAVSPVDIFNGPGSEFDPVGILEAGQAVKVTGSLQDNWFPIQCPDDADSRCWVLWDYNALYSYEGQQPLTLNIPEPDSLEIESTDTNVSPDGRWQAETTRSETAWLAGDSAGFFYTELNVRSLENDSVWPLIGEWHAAGLGEEGPARVFLWSEDGRFLYYTSTFDYHGACIVYTNVGDFFNRLELASGEVTSLQEPFPDGMLAFSPDERLMAYMSGSELVVRDTSTAFNQPGTTADKRPLPVEVVWPAGVSQIEWSADSSQIMVTIIVFDQVTCQITETSIWAMDVATGAFTKLS